jgi:hypothetical protein
MKWKAFARKLYRSTALHDEWRRRKITPHVPVCAGVTTVSVNTGSRNIIEGAPSTAFTEKRGRGEACNICLQQFQLHTAFLYVSRETWRAITVTEKNKCHHRSFLCKHVIWLRPGNWRTGRSMFKSSCLRHVKCNNTITKDIKKPF